MLKRLAKIAGYNRDWYRYVSSRFKPPRDGEVLYFRLRNGQRLALKAETRFLLNEIYLDRVYDLPGVDYSNCTKVLDLGGNVGLFALYVASRSARARIYSFEPSSENLSLLRANLEATGHAERIRVLPFAVAPSCGRVTLYLHGTPAEYSTVGDAKGSARSEEVRCVDVASIFELCEVDEFDIAKIDIEGAERELLNAASDEQLRRFKAIVLEWHYSWEALEQVASRFSSIGFHAQPILLEGHMRFLRATRQGPM
jgi:FkbM family methyltransferase